MKQFSLNRGSDEPHIDARNKNPPECIILDNWVFENFILADEPFAKPLRIFESCASVTNNLCGKLVPSLEFLIKFDERLKVTSIPFSIADFNLFKLWIRQFYIYCVILSHSYINILLKQNRIIIL